MILHKNQNFILFMKLKEIKFLSLYENINEMIDSFERIFTKGNVRVEEKMGYIIWN